MNSATCTVTAAATLLGVSRSTAFRAASTGHLAPGIRVLRVGHRLVVPIADLESKLGPHVRAQLRAA